MTLALLTAALVLETSRNGIDLKVEADRTVVDPGRSVFVTVELRTPRDVKASLPDLRERVRGFSLAEGFAEEPSRLADGTLVERTNWRLVPEPCADVYKIAPFAVTASPRLLSSAADEGSLSFVAGPVRFEGPPAREAVTGAMEADLTKDLPPLSWRLVGFVALALAAAAALVAGLVAAVRHLLRRVREHRMSPVERAWAELGRLLGRGLPGRGRYKDFYVELTMVVRRYIKRRHGVAAPHLTTEEFFGAVRRSPAFPAGTLGELMDFLAQADLVKFAGVTATPEAADEATERARAYIRKDDAIARGKGGAA